METVVSVSTDTIEVSDSSLVIDSLRCVGKVEDDLISEELGQPTSDCVKLDRIRGTYYLGDTPLTRKEYRNFLRVNAPENYNRYRTGNALWATGWSLMAVSTAAFLFGGICLVAGVMEILVTALFGFTSYTLSGLGLIVMASSAVVNAASVPCLVFGGIYKFSAHKLYNERCERQKTTLELSFQTGQNSVAFALSF